MCMVAGSCPVFVIVWECHIGLALLCGCSGALDYPTTNSCGSINKSLSLSLSLWLSYLSHWQVNSHLLDNLTGSRGGLIWWSEWTLSEPPPPRLVLLVLCGLNRYGNGVIWKIWQFFNQDFCSTLVLQAPIPGSYSYAWGDYNSSSLLLLYMVCLRC